MGEQSVASLHLHLKALKQLHGRKQVQTQQGSVEATSCCGAIRACQQVRLFAHLQSLSISKKVETSWEKLLHCAS